MNNTGFDFSLLPPHIITKILTFLNFQQQLDAARTCKSWYYASFDPIIRQNILVRIPQYHTLDRLDQLQRPFNTMVLERVTFNQFNNYLDLFAKFGQYIRKLEYVYCDLSLQQLYECILLTPNLTVLTFKVGSDTFASDVNLSEEQANAIKTILNRIEDFTVELDSPNSDGIQFIMRQMPKLKKLNFGSVGNCQNYIYKYLFDYFNMFTGEVRLDRLVIGDLAGQQAENFLNDFSKISQNLHIHELELGAVVIDTDTFNEEYTVKFDDLCKKLSSVRIFSMYSIGQTQMFYVNQYMTQLIDLSLTGMQDQDIRILGNLVNLQKLSINCEYFHEEFEEDYFLGVFVKLNQLQNLRLDYHVLSEGVLNEICTACTNLTVLELSNLQTNRFAIVFKSLTKLKRLRLEFYAEQRDFTVDCDITNLKFLEELEIYELAPGMTIDLIEKLPKLKSESLLNVKTILEQCHS